MRCDRKTNTPSQTTTMDARTEPHSPTEPFVDTAASVSTTSSASPTIIPSTIEVVINKGKGKQADTFLSGAGIKTNLATIVERYVFDGAQQARSNACKKLVELEKLQEIAVRLDLTEKSLSTGRVQNIEAMLGYSRGRIMEEPCDECALGKRPFVRCVVVDGLFQGSCVWCHYNSMGKDCSFRPITSKYLIYLLMIITNN